MATGRVIIWTGSWSRRKALAQAGIYELARAEDIPGARIRLQKGRPVVACIYAGATGWRAPEGTQHLFLDDVIDENIKAQCRARSAGVGE